jgi:DNA-binding winged helix-turn-helix (wHTH) protein
MRQGEIVSLSPKALEILSVLVQSGGTLVEKEHLISKVWPDTFVEEGNLSVHIFALRKALGQNSDGQSLIETVPRLGYRLRANVSEVDPEDVNLIVERHTISNFRIEEIEESPEVVNSTPVVPDSVHRVGQNRSSWE